MSYRSIKVRRIPIRGPNEFNCNAVDVEAYYSMGGMNYFTYKVEPRGYYICIQPVNASEYATSYAAFTGIKYFMKESKRFSQKSLVELADDPIAMTYAADFMERHGLMEE